MSLRSWGATVVSALLGTSVLLGISGMSAGTAHSATPIIARYTDTAYVSGVPTFGAISGIDRIGANRFAMISTDVGRGGPARFFTSQFSYTSGAAGFTSNPGIDGGGVLLGPGNIPPLPGSAQYLSLIHI